MSPSCPRSRRRRLVGVPILALAALLGSGCTEAPVPTDATGALTPVVPAGGEATVAEVASAEALEGYAFAFLRPLGEGPSGDAGALATHLGPMVEVCGDDGCAEPLASFTTGGSGNARVRVDADGDHFLVHWRPADSGTPAGTHVVIRVRVGEAVMGTAAARVVAPGPGGAGGDAGAPASILRTQAFAIRFALNRAASEPDPGGDAVSATVGDAGGVLELPGTTLRVPSGALEEAVEIGMARTPDPADAAYRFIPGSWVSFSPSGLSFATPATLAMRFDPAALPPEASEESIAIFRANPDGSRTPLPTTVDLVSGTAIAFLDGFSLYFLAPDYQNPIPGTLMWVGGAPEGPRDWHREDNWSPAVVPTEAFDVLIPSGGTHLPRITTGAMARGLRVFAGASLELAGAGIEVHGTLAAEGPVFGSVGSVILDGAAPQSVSGSVPDLLVARGEARLAGPLTVTGNLQVNGSDAALVVGAHTLLVEGDLETAGTGGRLVMDDLQSRVTVHGNARFQGGAGDDPTLRRGVLTLHGNLTQGQRSDALRASGNHQVVMAGVGTEQVISLADGGPGGSYLAHLETRNPGTVTFARSARISDLSWGDAGVGGRVVVSQGHRLDVRNALLRGPLQAPEFRIEGVLAASDGVPYLVDRTLFAGSGNPLTHQGIPDLPYVNVVIEGPDVRIADPWVRIRASLFLDSGTLRIQGNVLEVGGIHASPGAEGGTLRMEEGDRAVAETVDLRTVRPSFPGGTLWISGDLVGRETLVGAGTAHRTVFHGNLPQLIVGEGGFALGQVVLANTGPGVFIRTPALQASGADAAERFLDLVGNTTVQHPGDDHVSVGVAVFRSTSRTHFASPTDRAFNCVWALDEDGRVITVEPGNREVGCARFGDPSPRPVLSELADFTPPSRLEVTIVSPAGASAFDEGEPVSFQATATLGGAPVSASFTWSSSRDGALGTGASLVRSDLSAGVHLVEVLVDATAPDGSTLPGSANVLVVIRGEEEDPPEPPVLTSIELTGAEGALAPGESLGLHARGIDQYGLEMPGVAFTWRSSDACLASVGPTGTVTAHSPGSTTITVSSGDISASRPVEVAGFDATLPTSVLGNWQVCRRSTGEFLYRIEVTNQEEGGRITGRVYHSNGTSSFMSGNWGPTFYNMTWTRLVQGGERTFAINDLRGLSRDHLRGSYNDRITLSTYDVELRRSPASDP
jgi:hypothetical protein